MAASTVKSPSIVTSAIRLLTSAAAKTTEDKPIKYFEEMLLSKMKQLKNALLNDTNFDTLRQRLQSKKSEFWKSFLEEELKQGGKTEDKETERSKLEAWKLETRWKFVKICLSLMLELRVLLQEVVSEKSSMEKPPAKGSQNPKLNVDALSVSDQKVVLACIQFIISLGVYPNLLPGVGVPVDKRSGFSDLIRSENRLRSEKQLFECIEALLECTKHASLGSIILSRHLGDILTGLIQICHAPASAYKSDDKPTCAEDSTDVSNANRTSNPPDTDNIGPMSLGQSTDASAEPISSGQSELKIIEERDSLSCSSSSTSVRSMDSCNHRNDWKTSRIIIENNETLISTSEKEKCLLELERLVERVYQPLIVRELLMIQGGTKPKKQQKNTGFKTEGQKKAVLKEEDNVCSEERPKWFTNVCGQLLSARLMKANGVQAVLRGILENTTGKLVLLISHF